MDIEYVKLFTDTSIIINGLKNQLESGGIKYIIKDRVESAKLSGFGEPLASVEIHVSNTDFEKANKILIEFKEKIYS